MRRNATVAVLGHHVRLVVAEDIAGRSSTYDVTIDHDKRPAGKVFKQTFSRERRTPGARYVNASWDSPPIWTYRPACDGIGGECRSRLDALERLVEWAVG